MVVSQHGRALAHTPMRLDTQMLPVWSLILRGKFKNISEKLSSVSFPSPFLSRPSTPFLPQLPIQPTTTTILDSSFQLLPHIIILSQLPDRQLQHDGPNLRVSCDVPNLKLDRDQDVPFHPPPCPPLQLHLECSFVA